MGPPIYDSWFHLWLIYDGCGLGLTIFNEWYFFYLSSCPKPNTTSLSSFPPITVLIHPKYPYSLPLQVLSIFYGKNSLQERRRKLEFHQVSLGFLIRYMGLICGFLSSTNSNHILFYLFFKLWYFMCFHEFALNHNIMIYF